MYVGHLTGAQVYAPEGSLVYDGYTSSPSKDSNGNYMSGSGVGIYDTLNRPIASGSTSCGSGTSFTVSTSQGTAQYSLTCTTINVKTKFQQSGVNEASTQLTVIRSLTLPDAANSTYYFTYDCDWSSGNSACSSFSGQSAYYGELASGVSHTDRRLSRVARARVTFSRMSVAFAVQMKGLGFRLCLSI